MADGGNGSFVGQLGVTPVSKSRKSTVPGQGLFDMTFEKDSTANRSVSDIWNVPADEDSKKSLSALKRTPRSKWFPHLMAEDPLSPAQARTRQGSHALRKRGNLTDHLKKQRADISTTLDDVTSSATPFTPMTRQGPRLESTNIATPGRGDFTDMEMTFPTPRHQDLMDETGAVQNLLMETFSMNQSGRYESSFDRTEGDITLFDTSGRPSSPQSLLLQNPVEETGYNLIHTFHDCFSSHSQPANVLELVKGLEMACQNQMDELQKLQRTASTKDSLWAQLMCDLNLERSTWELIHVLYSDRINSDNMDNWDMETAIPLFTPSVKSDRKLAEDVFTKDSSIRQSQLVVDWLEKNTLSYLNNFPEKIRYFTDGVLWEATLGHLDEGKREPSMVSELDPDASSRQGKKLADSDYQDEQTLMKHLFACIRAGQVAMAQELCVKMGEPWRAASIEGWKLYHDPNAGRNIMDDDIEPIEGNMTRDLWKLSCWELARTAGYGKYEKAVYAALAGDIKSILPVCSNWYDYVWAYFRVMVDVLTEQSLRSCSPSTGQSVEGLPNEYWKSVLQPDLIFQEIEATPSVAEESLNPFHLTHKFVILGDLDRLIEAIHSWLQDSPNIHQLRFWAHLVLFVKGLGEVTQEEKCSAIMESYVRELTHKGHNTIVAQYTAQLPSALQVSCYAELLTGIQVPRDQRHCLNLGKNAGLDVAVITKSVVEQIRNTGLDTTSLETSGLDLGSASGVEISKVDQSKIEVIKWLVFEDTQRTEAIIQGNALMRQFLASRKVTATKAVLAQLPQDSVDVVRANWESENGEDVPLSVVVKNAIKEYHCIQAYLNAIWSFDTWLKHYHQNRPEPPPQRSLQTDFRGNVEYEQKMKTYHSEEALWQAKLMELSEDAETRMLDVLTFADGGWLVDLPDVDSTTPDENRARQMQVLRENCIPQITFLLHNVLHSTDQFSKCLKLADVIASEQYKLYKVFRQHELEKLLSLLHKSGSSLVDDSKTYLGYPI